MKKLSRKEFAFLVRIAKNVEGPKSKIETLNKKKAELDAQIAEQQQLIDAFEVGSVAITGGYTSGQLLEKKVVPALDENGAQKLDKGGRALTITKYIPMEGMLVESEDGYVINDGSLHLAEECETVNPKED